MLIQIRKEGHWFLVMLYTSTIILTNYTYGFSGPRHIVTEFQDVGGAGALGEEEGAQACAVIPHHHKFH